MQQTKRQQQRIDTAQRLYEAALQLFVTRGYEATTVEAIAKAAGVAKGTFFVHFRSKEAVLSRLGKLQIERLHTVIGAHADFASSDIRTQLGFIYRTLAAGVEEQPALARKLTLALLQGEHVFDDELLSFDQLDALLQPLLAAAQASGALRQDATSEELTVLVRGTYFVALAAWFRQTNQPLAPFVERMLDLALDGLRLPAHGED